MAYVPSLSSHSHCLIVVSCRVLCVCCCVSEADAQKKLKAKILAEKKAARRSSADGTSLPLSKRGSTEGSIAASAAPSGRQSSEGLHSAGGEGAGGGEIEFVENPDGTFTALARQSPTDSTQADDDADEDAAAREAEEQKPPEENYDIIFDGPKSPLIMATAAKHLHEMMRLIQEVPIEYRVEFINAYDDHGCSAIFFAIGPEHQECMQLLLDYGADPNHQNNKKNAPLHIACAIQNKKACRILIEHGANIQIENWQYQKPHEMVTERDKVSSTQAFLNLALETFQEKCANKEVFGTITRWQRSYYRSLYDIADVTDLGVLKYDVLEPMLDTMTPDGAITKPDPKWVFSFFKQWDVDKNGVISFPEFLHKITIMNNEKERIKKKLKRRQMLAAKRKKKKEAEAAKEEKKKEAAKALAETPASDA